MMKYQRFTHYTQNRQKRPEPIFRQVHTKDFTSRWYGASNNLEPTPAHGAMPALDYMSTSLKDVFSNCNPKNTKKQIH
jgi:hypothetical protein